MGSNVTKRRQGMMDWRDKNTNNAAVPTDCAVKNPLEDKGIQGLPGKVKAQIALKDELICRPKIVYYDSKVYCKKCKKGKTCKLHKDSNAKDISINKMN